MNVHESDSPRGFRFLPQPLFSLVLLVTWLMLVNSLHPRMVVLGVFYAIAVPWFSAAFLPVGPKIHSWSTGFKFVPLFVWDVVVANLYVAVIILRLGYKPRSSWMVVPLDIRSPFGIVTLANVISLTPGTVSARLNQDRTALLVHGLDVEDAAREVARIKARYEAPLKEVFDP